MYMQKRTSEKGYETRYVCPCRKCSVARLNEISYNKDACVTSFFNDKKKGGRTKAPPGVYAHEKNFRDHVNFKVDPVNTCPLASCGARVSDGDLATHMINTHPRCCFYVLTNDSEDESDPLMDNAYYDVCLRVRGFEGRREECVFVVERVARTCLHCKAAFEHAGQLADHAKECEGMKARTEKRKLYWEEEGAPTKRTKRSDGGRERLKTFTSKP